MRQPKRIEGLLTFEEWDHSNQPLIAWAAGPLRENNSVLRLSGYMLWMRIKYYYF